MPSQVLSRKKGRESTPLLVDEKGKNEASSVDDPATEVDKGNATGESIDPLDCIL